MQLIIKSKALTKLKELMISQPIGSYLRVGCIGGGCASFSYLIKETNDKKDDDIPLTIDGLEIIIDLKSATFLDGLEIDYSTSINNMGFVFKNPNAKQSCSCGLSFIV